MKQNYYTRVLSTAVVRVEVEVAWALAPQPKRGQALPELDLCRKQPAAQRVAQLSPSFTVNGFQRATFVKHLDNVSN